MKRLAADPLRDAMFLRVISSIPRGRVAAYSAVAAAAGYPFYHRAVARLLRTTGERVPWQRVTGVGGEIKLRGEAAFEQRFRLEREGVRFTGKRVAPEHILTSEALACLMLDSPAAALPPRWPRR
jgi:methylated-DNA-protein-cysteine methyltransferase-like protein